MIKAFLFIWLGFGHTETFDIEKFDSVAECEVVRESIIEINDLFDTKRVKCVPYEVK
ncbi:MAG: hypothetical protein ABFD07_14490 [Methanobacterium sp.]